MALSKSTALRRREVSALFGFQIDLKPGDWFPMMELTDNTRFSRLEDAPAAKEAPAKAAPAVEARGA